MASDFLQNGRKHHDYIIQRFIGSPERESISEKEFQPESMCPYSKKVRKYIPALCKTVTLVVPCGHCLKCQHKYQNALIYRMYNHNRFQKHCIYVTLTYNNEHYHDNPDVCRDDITKFLKRFRKSLADRTFSYYLVCERGDLRDRLHFHLLLWWNGDSSVQRVCKLVSDSWKINNEPIGFIYIDTDVNTSNSSSIASYISKYVSDSTKKCMFRSWSHGLGLDVLSCDRDTQQKMEYLRTVEYMPSDKKYTIAVPKYYIFKMFTPSVRSVWFNEYLNSDYYKKVLSFVDDTQQIQRSMDYYARYAERAINAYRIRCRKKAEKKRLL